MSETVKKSLLYFHVNELRELADRLSLVNSGNKMALILRILHFLQTGVKLTTPKFPQASYAVRGKSYPLEENSLMLKNGYKNDLKTRLFFKKLIGPHFHFTAFGIDWLNERWMEGKPPTYREFAVMWQEEYQRRKMQPAAPKEEWAYINFVQRFDPEASRETIHQAWSLEREKHKALVYELLRAR